MADEQTSAPTLIGLSEGEAQRLAAHQHHAGWLAQEEARLQHELAYVRGAAVQARAEFQALLARAYGVDAAHAPVAIDLTARTITVQQPAPASAPTEQPAAAEQE